MRSRGHSRTMTNGLVFPRSSRNVSVGTFLNVVLRRLLLTGWALEPNLYAAALPTSRCVLVLSLSLTGWVPNPNLYPAALAILLSQLASRLVLVQIASLTGWVPNPNLLAVAAALVIVLSHQAPAVSNLGNCHLQNPARCRLEKACLPWKSPKPRGAC